MDTGWDTNEIGASQMYLYHITASNSPTQFAASGLPSGSMFDPTSGSFTLNPSVTAIYNINVSASNAQGTGSATVRIAVHESATSAGPAQASGLYGLGTVLRITVYFAGPVIVSGNPRVVAGANFDYESGSGTSQLTFRHVVNVSDIGGIGFDMAFDFSAGTISDSVYGLSVLSEIPGPTYDAWWIEFSGKPAFSPGVMSSYSATVGTPVSGSFQGVNFASFSATGLPPGVTIDPKTGNLSGTPTTAGTYAAVVTAYDASGNSATDNVSFQVTGNALPLITSHAHLINLSARAYCDTGANALTAGFYISGDGSSTKPVLLRGIGPTLTEYGVADVVSKAALTLYRSDGHTVATNDGWGTDSLLSSTANSVGAFALPANSGDSAIVWALYPAAYTVQVTDDTGAGGTALAEVYDTASSDSSVKLVNLSARASIAESSNLTGGFVISGSGSETVLLRAIGPSLAAFGVPSPASAPVLTLFDAKSNPISSNTGWPATVVLNGQTVSLASVFSEVGAFSVPAGSADSALLVSLSAGSYTAQITPAAGSTGAIALLEIYEVSPP